MLTNLIVRRAITTTAPSKLHSITSSLFRYSPSPTRYVSRKHFR